MKKALLVLLLLAPMALRAQEATEDALRQERL